MQLSQEHITQLYAFTKKHHVDWYDLQTELVDHLANDIEQILADNTNLTFKQAQQRSYSKFGIMGFSEVVEKKQNYLYKKYWRLTWQFFKDYFKLPKIIVSLLCIALFYLLLNQTHNKRILILGALISLFIYPLIFAFYNLHIVKKRNVRTGKKWLFEHAIFSLGGIVPILLVPLQIYLLIEKKIVWDSLNQLIISTIIIMLGVFLHVVLKIIPLNIQETASKNFPEYKLLSKT